MGQNWLVSRARKYSGAPLGRSEKALAIVIGTMSGRSTRVHLSVEIGSEPICGQVTVELGHPEPFSGWIELAAAIECARHDSEGAVGLGPLPPSDAAL